MTPQVVEERLRTQTGKRVTVRLPSVPGAGAIWDLVKKPEEVYVERRVSRPAKEEIGGGIEQVFDLSSSFSGVFILDFELKRPWEDVVRKIHRVVLEIQAGK